MSGVEFDPILGQLRLKDSGGGSGSPGGSTSQIQYNNAGVFAGAAGLTTDGTNLTIADASNIVLGTGTGTQIGTASTQRLAFYGATPTVQAAGASDLGLVLSNLGLRAASTTYSVATSGNAAFTGAFRWASAILTANTTLTTSNGIYRLCDATIASFNVTLPVTTTAGFTFMIKKTDATANTVTVVGTIDGATNYVISIQNDYVIVESTTASGAWNIIGSGRLMPGIDAGYVHIAGSETITGAKTFSATTSMQAIQALYIRAGASPSTPITVQQASTGQTTINNQFNGIGAGDSSQVNSRFTASANAAANVFAKSRGATIGDMTAVADNDILGNTSFNGADGTNFIEAARIRALADLNGTSPTTGSVGGRLEFMTTTVGATSGPTTALTIFNNGRSWFQGAVGIGGTASTGGSPAQALTLPTGSSGLGIYNTTDQTTNYERLRAIWSTNVMVIGTETGGTGTGRALQLKSQQSAGSSSATTLTLNRSAAPLFNLVADGTSLAGSMALMNFTINSTTSQQNILALTPTVGQSGTASYTGLLINPTETTVGSGTKLLIDLQATSVSKFNVDNGGNVTHADGANIILGTTTGTQIGTSATQKLALFGKTPVVQPTAWTVTNVTPNTTFNATAQSTTTLGQAVGTLIQQLQSLGIIG